MTINITKNRTAKNSTKNNKETKHTDLSYHTGSCMAHLNCWPPRAAGVTGDDQASLTVNRTSAIYTIATNVLAVALRLMAASGDRSNVT